MIFIVVAFVSLSNETFKKRDFRKDLSVGSKKTEMIHGWLITTGFYEPG